MGTDFQPTRESTPPPNVSYQQSVLGLAPNVHPLKSHKNPFPFILRAAAVYPDKLAIAHPDVKHPAFYTYAVWAQRIQNMAYALIQAGIRPGDRVAVITPNWSHTFWNIVDPNLSSLIATSRISLRILIFLRLFVMTQAELGDPYESFLSAGRVFSAEKGWAGLDVEPDENAGAVLCYTSGTTGRPKGVLTTLRGSYLAAIGNVVEGQISRESTYLWILPMFHAAGWTYPWANVFACATQITMRSVDYPLIWKHFLDSGVTHYCGAPTVQIGIVNDPAARPLPRTISAVIAGAAPTAHLISQLEQKGIKPVHVYGLTETYGPFTRCYDQPHWKTLTLEQRAKLMARQGQSFATAQDARVVYPPQDENDEELRDVPKDGRTVGEVLMRGNIVMKEYFRDPEATRKAFQGRHFHSGDLAVWHPDGVIQVVDRSKDLIISGGEVNNYPCELSSHPHVLEVSVVARSHPKWGERPMAFVVLRPEHAAKWKDNHGGFATELIRHARTLLPGFACPEWVQMVDELPVSQMHNIHISKTSTGKILKTNLRKVVAKL
ncbi:uncharacterized protein BJ212DRAFT_1295378 [Suillus subaureus]|uniref:AMP-dependent synthetase/ligase domain-containing protein n=1 Tax=Suillus subaureus TaxID=48587 RepID=A0A9P7EMH4_9AGAM|nr:uncharacterized protein BJ212DRAFT_1295378 [Suillus subaureus]KAG1826116.1 hypothetical protein BJ212DRAFT_1295378 [Suillus subaureus]